MSVRIDELTLVELTVLYLAVDEQTFLEGALIEVNRFYMRPRKADVRKCDALYGPSI